jgi:AraC-like DNA-binding protein
VAFVRYRPSGPLSTCIDYLWWLSDAPAHAQERIVPTGTQELVINLQADAFDIRTASQAEPRRFSGAIVSGAYSKYFVIDTRAHASLLGVHFRPGGARSILATSPGNFADEHVDLELLWGGAARALRERLGEAGDMPARFQIVETELLGRLARSSRPHPAIDVAIERLVRPRRSVNEVAAELGFSCRRFIELFTTEVGMTPKLYARVQRFQSALAQARIEKPDWAELALRAGYCDQSHLIRDFAAFSGFAPTELLRHTGPALKEHHFA